MSDDAGSGGEWAASESKDWKDGRHKRDNAHVLPHAGEVSDRQTRRHLTALRAVYPLAFIRSLVDSPECREVPPRLSVRHFPRVREDVRVVALVPPVLPVLRL